MIKSYGFYDCRSLESVSFNNGLASIGRQAFGECRSLKEVTFPRSLTLIDNGAFIKSGVETAIFTGNKCVLGK